ncbi:MAG TPA: MBL fold metallo-hydrolase [Steroidobacteraceae bacterium]|nr:MBL fold metallo-hydrolase [Steroidobacteraceae bacterium]
MNPRITRHPDGIYAVDAEYVRPGHAAVHIIEQDGRAAFVDTGTNFSVPYLLAALEQLRIPREAVDHVLLTHVHLDHAGGAGLLLQKLPNARAFIHPRGVPHMTDPAKLIAGSKAVYGEEAFRQLYGEIVPIEAARIVSVADGDRCTLGSRTFELIHTPGHALHHYAIVDRAHSSIFAGDTFGISYREFDTARGAFILPTTTPSQFDPGQLIASIDRLLSYSPRAIYLMHYSRVTEIPRLAADLKAQIGEFVRLARASMDAPDPHAAIRAGMLELWVRLLNEHGCRLSAAQVAQALAGDLDLNAQGLVVWLERERKNKQSG